ncbi:MAG TPA: hypothetical protein DGL25_04120 [Dehalococcoidia bacterium]|nr:hypothetical protein [Dehalococcoidia bacterium]|tara:strand:- start:598 stop:1824 length:1227 start_codon:yes stop_codon:yes gene_type:complete
MVRAEIIERSKVLQETAPPLERLQGMKEALLKAGDEAQEIRHLPSWASNEIADQGLYRFALPQELGGEDLRAREQIEIVEAASAIDGSVGWCIHINSEINALVLRRMTVDFAHEYYDDWRVLTCGGVGPGLQNARARREEGGWRLWCQGSFGSGCHNATWTLVHTGSVGVPREGGGSSEKAFLIPRDDWEIVDTWDTAGLRGSGSHDVKVDGAFIPEQATLPMDLFSTCETFPNPTYRNPMQAHYNKGAVALGICRGAIDDLIALAMTKTPWTSGSLLADQPELQYRLGEAQATYRAARSFLIEAQEETEEHLGPLAKDGGRARPEWPVLQRNYLSCVHAAQSTRHIVDMIHNTAGTTASRMESPLERRLRDAHQAASHAAISWRHYRKLGSTYLGDDPPAFGVIARA